MVWSPKSATIAYLDTLKLCKHEHERNHETWPTASLESSEFLSALAAGTSSQLIVEVSPEASRSTIALAAAARQTGGRLVCILPESGSLAASQQVVDESGLNDKVEFKVGDPFRILHEYANIDFSVVDCNTESYAGLLKMLDVNPRRSVVVANNLDGGKEGLAAGDLKMLKEKGAVRSMKHPIGNGMEVTMIGESNEFGLKDGGNRVQKADRKGKSGLKDGGNWVQKADCKGKSAVGRHRIHRKSYWVKNVDEKSGEEHIYRMTKSI